jgi:hypothetical protein
LVVQRALHLDDWKDLRMADHLAGQTAPQWVVQWVDLKVDHLAGKMVVQTAVL